MKLIRCNGSQYIKRLDTEKAYAVQYSKYGNRNIMFLSKKHVKFTAERCEDDDMMYYWFEIPDWLCDRMSDADKLDLELFDEDASKRVAEHDARTNPRKSRWYDDRETCQFLKPF